MVIEVPACREMFGGKVPLRRGNANAGERPYLIARVGVNRNVLLEAAASAAGCVKCGSGGRICISHTPDFIDIPLR